MTKTLSTTLAALTTLATGLAPAQTPPPQLRVSMIALGVKDTARSIKFYSETLGLQLAGKPGEVTLVRAGDITIVLNHPLGSAAGDAMVGAVEIIFPVESVAASHGNLASRGCNFIRGPHEVTSGTWAATFTDPDGHRLTILGPR
jgi:predicted enzyme related to lactoylglutathione lyase